MGIKDLVPLNNLVNVCRQLEREYNWGFVFAWDQGTYETAIIIREDGCWKSGRLISGWNELGSDEMFCPDIIDFNRHIIIEFEESPGKPRSGARLAKKGHDPDGMDKRTSNRDLYYELAGFDVLKIFDFDSDADKKKKIKAFLVKNWKKTVLRVQN